MRYLFEKVGNEIEKIIDAAEKPDKYLEDKFQAEKNAGEDEHKKQRLRLLCNRVYDIRD